MNIMHYRSGQFSEGFYFLTGLCLPPFTVSAVHAACSSKFCKPKSSVSCLYNGQLNCKNSAQNALEIDILRSKVKKLSVPDRSLSGERDTPSQHPIPLGDFGASILAPAALDLAPPVCKSWIRHC